MKMKLKTCKTSAREASILKLMICLLTKNMRNKILICLSFLLLCISSFGSPMFCKQCKNKGYYYSYEMCPACKGSGKVTAILSGKHGGRSTRVGRCSNCSKLGSGCKTGYIRVKRRCSCCSSCKYSKKRKRQVDPKLKTFYRR